MSVDVYVQSGISVTVQTTAGPVYTASSSVAQSSVSVAGTNGQLQYNNNGNLGATTATWDANAERLSVNTIETNSLTNNGNSFITPTALFDNANGVPAVIFGDDHILNDVGGNALVNFVGNGNPLIVYAGLDLHGNISRDDNVLSISAVGGVQLIDNGTTILTAMTNGGPKVGIGQTDPQYLLDVNGDMFIQGNLNFGTVNGNYGTLFSNYGGGAFSFNLHGGTDVNLSIQDGNQVFGGLGAGVAFASVNDISSANLPMQFRASTYNFWSSPVTMDGALTVAGTIKGAGYRSSDNSAGLTTTVTYMKTASTSGVMTFKNGLLTAVT